MFNAAGHCRTRRNQRAKSLGESKGPLASWGSEGPDGITAPDPQSGERVRARGHGPPHPHRVMDPRPCGRVVGPRLTAVSRVRRGVMRPKTCSGIKDPRPAVGHHPQQEGRKLTELGLGACVRKKTEKWGPKCRRWA